MTRCALDSPLTYWEIAPCVRRIASEVKSTLEQDETFYQLYVPDGIDASGLVRDLVALGAALGDELESAGLRVWCSPDIQDRREVCEGPGNTTFTHTLDWRIECEGPQRRVLRCTLRGSQTTDFEALIRAE
jgi:hypothetical protein